MFLSRDINTLERDLASILMKEPFLTDRMAIYQANRDKRLILERIEELKKEQKGCSQAQVSNKKRGKKK